MLPLALFGSNFAALIGRSRTTQAISPSFGAGIAWLPVELGQRLGEVDVVLTRSAGDLQHSFNAFSAYCRDYRRNGRSAQPLREKAQHTRHSLVCRLALAVDKVDSEDTVWRLGLRLCRRGWKLDPLKAVAEFTA